MGMLNKIKSILFDEDIVEIPVRTDVPEKEEKKPKNTGFIDHSQDEDIEIENTFIDEEDDDDPITQVIVPKEETRVKEEEIVPTRENRFPIEDFEETPSRVETKREKEEYKEPTPRRDYSSLIQTEHKVEKREEKDYRKFLEPKEEVSEKKPFKVTPVISPVYGVINETPKMEEELITIPIMKSDDSKPRMFGPVSFNDTPLPTKKKREVKEESEVVKKLDENINTIIEEPIEEEVAELPQPKENIIEEEIEDSFNDYVDTREMNVVEESNIYDEAPIEDEEVIASPDYDDLDGIETSGIEEEYLNAPSVYEDEEEKEVVIPTDDVIKDVQNEEDEDAHLDDTIETDLFNLIDSMYKDEDEDEIEEE